MAGRAGDEPDLLRAPPPAGDYTGSLWMRPPRCSLEQLYLLRHEQRPKAHGKALDKIFVRVHRRPMRPPIRVVVKLPKMDKLVDRAGISLEIADQLLVLPALLKRRKAEFLIELHGLRNGADAERVRSQFVESHPRNPP